MKNVMWKGELGSSINLDHTTGHFKKRLRINEISPLIWSDYIAVRLVYQP
jgi:hypothetical protein